MNKLLQFALLLTMLFSLFSNSILAQETIMTESGPQLIQNQKECKKPLDGFYERTLHTEKRPLAYDYIHEKDVFWEKRIWRELDTREKMNHAFISPHKPLINVILDAAQGGEITLYSTWDDQFSIPLGNKELQHILYSTDTVIIYNPDTFEDTMVVVYNEFDWESIQKYRLKEVWFFDEETSSLGVRILGLAPIMNRYDDNGEFLHSAPIFWAYYPELRNTFARTETFNPLNDAARLSWDDIFEARMFSSYIIKENNIHDRRISDYTPNGVSALLEGERIKDEIFNFEHDLWSY